MAAPDRIVGKWIGQYTITRRNAGRGMSEVCEAEQEKPLRRRVAWMVIRAGMDSHAVVSRFEHERQTLTRMDRPNIAKILDAGTTPDGSLWLAVEFVAGEPIADYCDRHRMSIRARRGMFVSVCDALQHAHARDIIHRDIKPSNPLVGNVTAADSSHSRLQPMVIDFGIAKALGENPARRADIGMTEVGAPIGTPACMSPERAAGTADIDVRTDDYSLGSLEWTSG